MTPEQQLTLRWALNMLRTQSETEADLAADALEKSFAVPDGPLGAFILDVLEPRTDEERLLVLNAIREAFCIECGREHPRRAGLGVCQCWNDE